MEAVSNKYILRRLGYFNAWFGAIVQFNSICFRLIAGILGLLPLESVAIISFFEYTLNCLLEVPLGYFADKFGRVLSVVSGLVLVIVALCCCFIAIELGGHSKLALLFVYLDGILLGVAKPLISGSVQGFYQEFLKKNNEDQNEEHNSFTFSMKYGKYISSLVIILAIILLVLLSKTKYVHYLLIFGGLLYFINIKMILKDYVVFKKLYSEDIIELNYKISSFFQIKNVNEALFTNIVLWMIGAPIMSYLIISLGRTYDGINSKYTWYTIASFMLGMQTLGSILNGTLLQVLKNKLDDKYYIILLILIPGILVIFPLLFVSFNSIFAFVIWLYFFGAFYFMAIRGIGAYSSNKILEGVDSKHYSKVLSMLSMVGFIFHGCYDLYIAKYSNGAPFLLSSFKMVLVISVVSALLYLIFWNKKCQRSSIA
ncbi:MAG TPA: hypothetical protein PKC21_08920 [Oligoflexia bacterium]|nr:hypothetical protein [Oligoflexia bacterium]HMR25461.1 hypothetical protein [Oligoflexia bacterium]